MKRFRRLISLSFQLALILLLTSSIMGINISPPSNSLHDRGEKHFLTLQDGIQNRTQANLPQGIHQVWWTQIQEDIRRANSPITADPLTVPAEWIKGSDQASSSFGLSIASAGDVNADGFDDILVGAPYSELHFSIKMVTVFTKVQ